MGSSSRLPHLLNTHLSLPPQGSLILLTGVVNASTNWLLLRFLLSSELSGAVQQPPSSVEVSHSVSRIVLVSFLRDWEFWRDGARRIVGEHSSMHSKPRVYPVIRASMSTNALGEDPSPLLMAFLGYSPQKRLQMAAQKIRQECWRCRIQAYEASRNQSHGV